MYRNSDEVTMLWNASGVERVLNCKAVCIFEEWFKAGISTRCCGATITMSQ